jgi:hypothetical protein
VADSSSLVNCLDQCHADCKCTRRFLGHQPRLATDASASMWRTAPTCPSTPSGFERDSPFKDQPLNSLRQPSGCQPDLQASKQCVKQCCHSNSTPAYTHSLLHSIPMTAQLHHYELSAYHETHVAISNMTNAWIQSALLSSS